MSDAALEQEVFLGETHPGAFESETEEASEDLDSEEEGQAIDLEALEIMPGGCRCPSQPHQIGATRTPSTAASCSLRCSVEPSCAMF